VKKVNNLRLTLFFNTKTYTAPTMDTIRQLFDLVYDSNDVKKDEKKSLYATIREILKHRRSLGVDEDVASLLSGKGYDAFFTHFTENYTGDESKRHIQNLDTLHSLYLEHITEDEGQQIDESDSESEDSDLSNDDSHTDGDNGVVNVIVDVTSSLEQALVPNRWLLGLNVVLGFGNFVLTAFMLQKLVLPLYR